MELWERSATLELLDGLLGECARGGGRVAVVAGEAGIGKSVLVNEFARRCGARARVLWGGCDRLVTPRALGPLHDIGRQTGGVLAERLGAGAAQEEIFAASLEELSGATGAPVELAGATRGSVAMSGPEAVGGSVAAGGRAAAGGSAVVNWSGRRTGRRPSRPRAGCRPWSWWRTRTGPTRPRSTGWCGWGGGSAGCRRCWW
ncbi:AAA family ATPase [[Actinomadura] parvosata]|uniref:AAA family ATPase n=1 Tax=[Actinomadura] parvosata TaxID=1955412 RepID=UPI001647072E